jgi:hypothetical protein
MNSFEDEWFVIKDMDMFINYTRNMIYENYGDAKTEDVSKELDSQEIQELDRILSFDESLNIVKGLVKKQKNKKNDAIRFIVNDDSYMKIIQSLTDRMTSNILTSLVKKGVVETAYDSEENDFIFWIKNDQKEKPKTD